MASGVFDDALIKHLWSTDELRAIFSDANRVQKWYDFEAALALEQAALGIIPRAAAQEIAARAKVENVDIEAIAAEIRRIKHPLVPALKAVEKLCQDGHGEYIHFGPTTQDVLDTGTMLQMRDGREPLKTVAYYGGIEAQGGTVDWRFVPSFGRWRVIPGLGEFPAFVEEEEPEPNVTVTEIYGPPVDPDDDNK